MNTDLTLIIKNCKKGDKKAFHLLVENQKQFAYQVALTYVHSVEDALDISQDAFIKLIRNIQSYDLNKPFSPWFFQIIKNLCLSFLRKNKQKNHIDASDYYLLESNDKNALESETDKELTNILIKEINGLPQDLRLILIMKEFQNLSYKEISECLEIPLGTVMSRLYNARQVLKDKVLEVYNG